MFFPFSPSNFVSRLFLAVCAALLCLSSSAAAAEGQKSLTTRGELPWTLNADKLVSLEDGVIVEATGSVLLQRGEDYMKADFARYYTTTNWIFVQGHVEARMGRDMLNAAEAEFDLTSRTGWLKDGSIFIAGPHMYVTGEKVDKLFGDRYLFKNAKVTACDGDVPAWSLAAEQAEIEIDGYAKLSHTTLNILDMPLVGSPFLVLPAKTTRQSGLLMPDFGYSSLNGAFFSVPYFQVIDESRDLTFYSTYMSRAGFMPGIEYRSHTRDQDKTWLAFDFLYDKHKFSTEKGDRINDTDGKVNTNEERFWLRGMGDGFVGDSGWRYRYNLDYVSDQNFLRQFRDMRTGFNHSRDALYDMFGRDLQEVDKNRVSEGFVYRDWDRFMVSLGFRYEQIPYLGHGNTPHSEDTTVQRIPLNLYLFKGRMLEELPLELQGEVSSAYEYRAKGIRGLRTEIHPELSLPVNLPGASMLLTGGIRQTYYNSTHTELVDSQRWTRGGGTKDRFIPDMSAELFTQASRVWEMPENHLEATAENVGRTSWTGLRHRVQPRLTYAWTPEKDQSENPIFEEMDRIKPSQRLRLSFTNILTARRETVSGAKGNYKTGTSYFDPVRWEIATGYDIDEAERTKYRNLYGRRPWMDAYSYLELRPVNWLSLWNRLYVSMYGEGITRSDTGATLSNARWGSWSVSYSTRDKYYNYLDEMKRDNLSDMRFTSPQRLLTNTFTFRPWSNISLYYRTQDNIETGKNYERHFAIGYYHQCFHLIGSIQNKARDNSYRVILELPGLNF
ncbi:LPS-assembly protein LptD [Mailhella massiliensis]|uniref:LPS assembly protein LptD n=1 Tax=Mailhella massiliensis TaxID=1903261 RepID=A0A921AU97_9BACT|nr:LPS assembly protein LptD [Mailhella massiliensis]HJD96492.1 LPS assembly protein LptD [Mailhella massiliensis]